jgi:hypothetical protein
VLAVERACDEPGAIVAENAQRLYRLADAPVPFLREQT